MNGTARPPLRVLQVIASLAPRYGGPSTAMVGLARALVQRGHDVEIFTTDRGGFPPDVAIEGVRVSCFPVWRPGDFGVSAGLARALHRRIGDFDVVHVHSLYLFHTLVACGLARRRGVPYILRPHGTLDPYHRAHGRMRKALYDRLFERRNLRLAAAVHYASDVERGHAEAAGVEGRAFVAPLGVDAGTFTSDAGASFARRHPELAEQKLVTFLGRITEKKGLDILLDALAVMQEPGVRLVVAGPDDEGLAAQLRKRAARLGIADRVSFIGPVTDEKSALLARSAVFVLPSRDENFGIAVVEAMAAGVPVVVTRGVAIHDIVADAGAGIVVERSPNAVADALKRVLDDDDLARSLGRNAAALARAQFTWDNRVVEVERMYYEAITG